MTLKIKGKQFNYTAFIDLCEEEGMNAVLDKVNQEITISYTTSKEYEKIIYNCASVIGWEMFLTELMKKLEVIGASKQLGSEAVKELATGQMLIYISLNFFKLIREYLKGEDVLNVDAFKTFRVKNVDKEVALFVNAIQKQAKFNQYVSNAESSSVDLLRGQLEESMKEGENITVLLPIISEIYDKGKKNEIIDFHLVKKDKLPTIVDERGYVLQLEGLLELIHPEIELEMIGLKDFSKYLNDIALMVHIVKPKRLIHHSSSFSPQENKDIVSTIKSLKKIFPQIETYKGSQ